LALPPSVKVIGAYAFRGCGGLASVTIPSSVASVADGAFFGCDEVTSVTICGECPKSGKNVFGKCRKLAAIHVPANAKSWAGMREWQGISLVFDAKDE